MQILHLRDANIDNVKSRNNGSLLPDALKTMTLASTSSITTNHQWRRMGVCVYSVDAEKRSTNSTHRILPTSTRGFNHQQFQTIHRSHRQRRRYYYRPTVGPGFKKKKKKSSILPKIKWIRKKIYFHELKKNRFINWIKVLLFINKLKFYWIINLMFIR